MTEIPPPSTLAPARERKLLLVRLCNWVGEVVLSIPAIDALAGAGWDVHLYGKSWAPALLQGLGYPVSVRVAGLGAVAQLRGIARQSHPRPRRASALLLTRSFSSALETRAAGMRPSGYAYDGRSFLLTHAYPRPAGLHAAADYWHLAHRFLGRDTPFAVSRAYLAPSPAQVQKAHDLLAAEGLGHAGYTVLCPFSGSDDRDGGKVWPGFPALHAALLAEGARTLVCPGPGELERSAAQFPGASILPGVDLGTYAALMQAAARVVANDTGPGHIAAAVGARLVGVYGPRSSAIWGPIGPRVRLLHGTDAWPEVETVLGLVRAIDRL